MSEINVKELLQVLLRKWWLILLCTLIAGGGMLAYTKYRIVPLYQSDLTMYVGKNADERGLNVGDLSIGTYVLQDYSQIAKSRLVASAVIEELGLKGISAAGLAGKVTVSLTEGTRVVKLSVTDPDPNMAMIIANKEAEVFQQKVKDIMQVENVQIIDKAELPRSPVSPDLKKNVMLGLIIGFAVGAGISLLIEVLDNTVKTPEDIKKTVDLPVLGTIPVFTVKRRGA